MWALLISISFATTWIIKAPQANPHDFHVYSQNSTDAKISTAFSSCQYTDRLRQLLKEGQYHFLDGSLKVASDKFEQIIDMRWNCDWKENERKVIVFSLMRSAQLTESPSKQLQLVTEAVNFDESLEPDEALFPPPLMRLYHKSKEQMAKVDFVIPDEFKKYTALFRNGKFLSLNSLAVSIHQQRARFTLISDSYRSETLISSVDELKNLHLEPVPLVEGHCHSFKVVDEVKSLANFKIFFDLNCIPSNTEPRAALESISPNTSLTSPPQSHVPTRKSWIERNWVWIGVAVVGSAVVAHQIYQNQNEPKTVVIPSNTFSGTTP